MKIIGHRGAKNEYPENTILGFRQAITSGVHGIELDVHKSADGQLVVIHDPSLERTTNGKGLVKSLTYDELLRLDAGKGERIPLLREVLEMCINVNLQVFVESKIDAIERDLVDLVVDLKAYDHVKVICFDHIFIKNIKDLDKKIQCGCLLVGKPGLPAEMVKAAHADLLAVNIHTCDPSLVQKCQKQGIEVAVWNANTLSEVKYLDKIGVDYIMTDIPKEIITKLNL